MIIHSAPYASTSKLFLFFSLFALTTLLSIGCRGGNDDDTSDADIEDSGGEDSDVSEDSDRETDGDAEQSECSALITTGSAFELFPDLPNTQIHPSATFAQDQIWVAFVLPESDSSLFDIWAARLSCDGSLIGEPFQVNTLEETNDIDPMIIELSDGRILIVWQSDTGSAEANMQVFYRTYSSDGEPVENEETRLETTFEGELYVSNIMYPVATALSGGGFAIAATRGVPVVSSFQVFVQRFSDVGVLDGETLNGFIREDDLQSVSSVATTPQGEIYLCWTTQPEKTEHVVCKVMDGSTDEPEMMAPDAISSNAPSLFPAHDSDDIVYLAFAAQTAAGYEIRVTQLGIESAQRSSFSIQQSGRIIHTPVLSSHSGGGAVAWFAIISGIRNEAYIKGFDDVENEFSPADQILADNTDPVAPYAASLTQLAGEHHFLLWSEGTSPDFRIFGQVIDVLP